MADRIAVVDDNKDSLKVLSLLLTTNGYDVLEISSGPEAKEILSHPEGKVDLIILDILMPEVDGFQVCESLKANPETANIPVIFLSALDQDDEKVRGLQLGGVDYLTRPFSKKELLARLDRHLHAQKKEENLRRTNRDLEIRERVLQAELAAAAKIQEALLPEKNLTFEGLNTSWSFIPCASVAGDLLNVCELNERYVQAYIIDVSGHGTSAALVTATLAEALRQLSLEVAINPSAVLRELNEDFIFERFEKYFSAIYIILDRQTGKLSFANAGHPSGVVFNRDQRFELIENTGAIIGLKPSNEFETQVIQLSPGDRIFLYTDGLVECENQSGTSFGEEQLHKFLMSHQAAAIEEITQDIENTLKQFRGSETFEDDVSILAVEYKLASDSENETEKAP